VFVVNEFYESVNLLLVGLLSIDFSSSTLVSSVNKHPEKRGIQNCKERVLKKFTHVVFRWLLYQFSSEQIEILNM
jgi:hypothetical protein